MNIMLVLLNNLTTSTACSHEIVEL